MKIRNPFILNLAGWVVATSVRLIFRTLSIESHVSVPVADPRHPNCKSRHLYCVWHESVLQPIGLCTVDNMAGLVSRHQDGGVLAMAMKHLKIRAVRGSSSKGGTRALRELLDVAKDWHIAITPDGPRGPRRKLKDGIIYLASQSGNSVVPMAFACHNAWIVRGNWTDLVIPKPFSKLVAFAGPPLEVPAGLDREGIARYRERLQEEMDLLDERVERALQDSEEPQEYKRRLNLMVRCMKNAPCKPSVI